MFTIMPFAIFGVFFIVFLMIAVRTAKLHKKAGKTISNIFETVSSNVEQQIENRLGQSKEETKTCEYCGSTIPADSSKCDSCGAKIKK